MESRAVFLGHLKRDFALICLSVFVAVLASKSGLLEQVLLLSAESEIVGTLMAGVLFTSFFTTPLAIAMFLSLATQMNIFVFIAAGALGALLGDLFLYAFIRHTFKQDVDYVLARPRYRRLMALLHRRTFRWLLPFIGALIIASPLPEEIGITIMSVAKMKTSTLAAISFVTNSLAIGFISLIA